MSSLRIRYANLAGCAGASTISTLLGLARRRTY